MKITKKQQLRPRGRSDEKRQSIEHEYCKSGTNVERLVFHPDYTNADFVGQILPVVDPTDKQVTYTFNQGKNAKFAPTFEPELQPTLVAKGPGAIQSGYTVRRLTPTECARLQGFPDWWCDDLGIAEPTIEDIHYCV